MKKCIFKSKNEINEHFSNVSTNSPLINSNLIITLDIANSKKEALNVSVESMTDVFEDTLLAVKNVADNWIVNVLPNEEYISIIELLGATVQIADLNVEYYVQLEFTTKAEPLS